MGWWIFLAVVLALALVMIAVRLRLNRVLRLPVVACPVCQNSEWKFQAFLRWDKRTNMPIVMGYSGSMQCARCENHFTATSDPQILNSDSLTPNDAAIIAAVRKHHAMMQERKALS